MANRNLTTPGSLSGKAPGLARAGLLRVVPLAVGIGCASLAWAQAAVEYGAVGARQGEAAVGAGTAVAPTTVQMAAVDTKATKKRGATSETTRIDGPNCVGEMGAPTVVSVPVGKSNLLRLPEPVVKRTIGNPDIIETRLVAPQTLYVLGVDTGSTNMILQGKSGKCVAVDVLVGFDGGALEAKIRELFPDENGVRISSAADSLVLSGTVSDAMRASQVVQLANAYVRTGQPSGAAGGRAGGASASGTQPISPRVVNMMSVAAPQQVMLEVKVAEVSKTLLEKLGAQVGFSRDNGSWTYSFLSDFLSGGGGALSAFKNSSNLLTVDAEDKEELVKILAEPMIMAISGQEGSFLAGGKIFIPVSQNNALGGAATITLEEKEFGVGLKFTPTVLAGGRINLRVAPEVSEVNPEGIGVSLSTGLLTGTSILPSITTRRAATTVQLMDGQSFAIGGLIKNNAKQNIKAYPFLGEIPVLGALFRSNEFSRDRTELLFVITPRLVKPLPPNYALPTDAYSEPSRAGRLLNGEMEGKRDAQPEGRRSEAGSATAMSAQSAGGFEVK